MKIIDLLNKIANGEEVPKKIRIDHWCYEFEWIEHESNYYDKHEDIDLMSCLSMDKEELNYEVHELKEKKKIQKLIPTSLKGIDNLDEKIDIAHIDTISAIRTINEIIDYLKEKENKYE